MVGDFIWVKLSSLGQFGMMQAGGDTNPYPPWESHPEKTSPPWGVTHGESMGNLM
jgi:hypothetical protein